MRKQADLDAALRYAELAHVMADFSEDLNRRGYAELADSVGLAVREMCNAAASEILNNVGVPFNAARP